MGSVTDAPNIRFEFYNAVGNAFADSVPSM